MSIKQAVLLSGGVDSMVALAKLLTLYPEPQHVTTFSIKYPSKHNALEREASENIATYFRVKFVEIDLTHVFASFKSALLTSSSKPIPEGHYEAESMKDTVVPLRNFIFATIISGILASQLNNDDKIAQLWLGIHAGDHAIYPDCRQEANSFLARAIGEATENKVFLVTPFINMDKIEIVRTGLSLAAPFKLTRTCYTDDPIACGKCGSCTERLEAFKTNGVLDPIAYRV
jgi:7-cyano-7-deazaguanine synthase